MFPLSFSSSSSLSSTPPSLDCISELDHHLSDISEDDDVIVDMSAAHTHRALTSNSSSLLSDQQLGDPEHVAQTPPGSSPITSCSQTHSSELLEMEKGYKAETGAMTALPSWYSLRGVVKYVSLVLCFISMLGKNGRKHQPAKLFLGLTSRMGSFTNTVSNLISRSARTLKTFNVRAPKCITSSKAMSTLCQLVCSLTSQLIQFLAALTRYLPTKLISLIPVLALHPKREHFLSTSSYPSVVSSFTAYFSRSSLPFSVPSRSSLLTFSSCSRAKLTASVHDYLLKPSPLLLPCLLVVFLLVVMLTASQSLVLALILATPLGLTLYYLENLVSSQRRAVLPVFATEKPSSPSEDEFSSGVDPEASCLTPSHTPPRIRHLAHTSVTRTQEMCDPAA